MRLCFVVSDRAREEQVRDAAPSIQLDARQTRWFAASADIRALRQMVKDGPMSVDESSKALLTASLAVAMVKNDDAGNTRLVKRSGNNTARDDVAAALVLAAGAVERHKPWVNNETPAFSGFRVMSRFHTALGRPAQTAFRHAVLLRDGFPVSSVRPAGRGVRSAPRQRRWSKAASTILENGQTVCRAPCHFDLHRPAPSADKVVWDKLLTRLLLSA